MTISSRLLGSSVTFTFQRLVQGSKSSSKACPNVMPFLSTKPTNIQFPRRNLVGVCEQPFSNFLGAGPLVMAVPPADRTTMEPSNSLFHTYETQPSTSSPVMAFLSTDPATEPPVDQAVFELWTVVPSVAFPPTV